ncbi:MAG: Crp/Fnr family transcriptional regulator [Inhella sp.]|jgi:CRP/FNR family transcriptional regulator|uniref:Crp/Fnr family transcriptional regulator n=1 Tax=Inhella sp. TaxID=1921806 RepID=UPI0022C066C4|nr:Crp/Fnr family transcriptional regulator [Inhella sp.]MCZ8234297.1 Crp/Fnr family transcriptional regulator [Inhella sp.]
MNASMLTDSSAQRALSNARPDGLPVATFAGSGGGSLQELVRLLTASSASRVDPSWTVHIPILRVRAESALLHEGTPGQSLYVVRSGSFKCVRTMEDGYEKVLTLAQVGDLLGFEALHASPRQATALALEDATVYALPLGELRDLQQRCPALDEAVRHGLSRQLTRSAQIAEMMSAVASDVRLARFVLWLSARMTDMGQSGHRIRLRLSRRDIASLLGLAHETVSRSFTLLSQSRCLRVDNREIEILDMAALRLRARTTRGLSLHGDLPPRTAAVAQPLTGPVPEPLSSAAWWRWPLAS